MTQPLLIMLCTDKVVNGWSTVLFWIERVMVWHALMFDSFVPKWPNQSCASLFIIEGLLMFKWESTTFCCNASHIFLADNTIGYTTNAAWIENGLPNPILHTCVWNGHMLDWRQQYEEMYTTINNSRVFQFSPSSACLTSVVFPSCLHESSFSCPWLPFCKLLIHPSSWYLESSSRLSLPLKLWWTCIIIEEAKVEMNFQDITTMDGSKVYRMAAKDRKKKTRASKMGKRQK